MIARIIAGTAAAIILMATLSPVRAEPGGATSVWCVGCRELDGLDFIKNIVLFVPFGLGLALAGCRIGRATVIGVLLSLSVEALQFFIPGRSPLVADLAANSIGTYVGAALLIHHRRWLTPSPVGARAAAAAFGASFVAVILATAVLVKPATAVDPLFGQWAPDQRAFSRFTGQLNAVQVAGRPLPYGPLIDSAPYRSALASRSLLIAADVVTGPARRDRVAAITRMVRSRTEMFLIGQRGPDLIFRLRLRAADAGLRTVTIAVPGALPRAPERVRLEGGLDGDTLFARVVRPSGAIESRLTLDASIGWAFLLPFEVPLGPWAVAVSYAWLALLASPIGFYAAAAAERRRRSNVAAPRQIDMWMLIAPASLVAGIGLAPYLADAATASGLQWFSGFGGMVLGATCWRRLHLREARLGRAGDDARESAAPQPQP